MSRFGNELWENDVGYVIKKWSLPPKIRLRCDRVAYTVIKIWPVTHDCTEKLPVTL